MSKRPDITIYGPRDVAPVDRPHVPAAPTDPEPRYHSEGPISSWLTRLSAERDARTIGALTNRRRAATAFLEADAAYARKEHDRQLARFELYDLPERLGHELALRRSDRTQQLVGKLHEYTLNRGKRQIELLNMETAITDARQQLEAQQRYGGRMRALEWEKRLHETIDLELDLEAKREMIRNIKAGDGKEPHPVEHGNEDAVLDALYHYRQKLEANGLDTSKIDAAIREHKQR
jgi:hypothetical protein